MWRRLALSRPALTQHSAIASAASAAAASASASLCCRCESVPSSCAAAAIPRPLHRSFHSSSSLRIQAAPSGGGAGRSRTKKLAERAEAAAQEAAQAAHDAKHTSKLKALLKARAAEDAALAAAETAVVYRKPKIKRKGRAYEAREAFIAEAEGSNDLEAMLAQLDAADKQEEAEAREAAAKERQSSGGKAPLFPFDPAVGPATGSGSAASAVSAPVVSSLQSQLQSLDALPALPHNAGGIGFDSIRLDTTDVLADEVFESRQLTPAMQSLRDDRDRKYQFQRVERVTEKTRDIVGRVLLEESIKIGEAQAMWAQQLAAYSTALGHAVATGAPRPRKPKPPPAASRMDLRRTPSFQIHDVRYSTDAGYCNIMWTLGKEGFSKEQLPVEPQTEKRKTAKQAAAQAASAESAEEEVTAPLGSAPLGSWSDSKRLVSNTLEHVLRTVRFQLGRELNLKYTPVVRITYDEKHAAAKEREQLEAEAEAQEQARMEEQQQQEQTASATDPSSSSSSSSSSLAALASAKSSLLGVDPSSLDLNFSSLAHQLLGPAGSADMDLAREFEESKQWRIPPRKLAAQEARRKLKEKRFEERRKQREMLREARKHAEGIDTREVQPLEDPFAALDPTTARNPSEMRRQLKATMAALVSKARPDRSPERLQKLRDSRASLTMLNQIQALHRKLEINPVAELKKSMARQATKQYPKDWRNMKDQFYKR